jgi:hypothetical protein
MRTPRLLVCALLGCAATSQVDGGASTGPSSLTALPLGDGKISTAPQLGNIYSCVTSFHGMGAAASGPWISDSGTFNFTAKAVVAGDVDWPDASFALAVDAGTTLVVGNDLPDHATGTFPIAASDPAYAYDQNPNHIAAQRVSYALPANPTVAASATCLGQGPIGILLTGAYLFNGLDALGRDALAHEIQDSCQGHPDVSSSYHYHTLTTCLPDPGTGHSALLGYALDGFGIYGNRGESGEALTDADLDECHGHTHAIAWNGQTVSLYHYHATPEYPYSLGCYRGTPIVNAP